MGAGARRVAISSRCCCAPAGLRMLKKFDKKDEESGEDYKRPGEAGPWHRFSDLSREPSFAAFVPARTPRPNDEQILGSQPA